MLCANTGTLTLTDELWNIQNLTTDSIIILVTTHFTKFCFCIVLIYQYSKFHLTFTLSKADSIQGGALHLSKTTELRADTKQVWAASANTQTHWTLTWQSDRSSLSWVPARTRDPVNPQVTTNEDMVSTQATNLYLSGEMNYSYEQHHYYLIILNKNFNINCFCGKITFKNFPHISCLYFLKQDTDFRNIHQKLLGPFRV